MKNLSTFSMLLKGGVFAILCITASCSADLATPQSAGVSEFRLGARTDFSGLESQVRVKVSKRDGIPLSWILTCQYQGTTTEGYGIYRYTTSIPTSGFYTVTGIIGDDCEGW